MALPSLTLRNTKGSALTFTEMDNNLTNLQLANIEVTAGGVTSSVGFSGGFALLAGANISITNSSGNITISNTQPPPTPYGDSNVAAFTGNITATVNGFEIGYRNMPQVAAGNVTLALADSGKHFYSTSGATTTVTIPNNANVAFDTGTVISVVNQGAGNVVIARQDAANLYLGGNATIANRTITTYGVATLMKVATDTWFINGTGVV
jgi:hypothetical protein